MSTAVVCAKRVIWSLAAALAVVDCAATAPDILPSPVELKPFRAFTRIGISKDGNTLVGVGNVAWRKRIDQIMAWTVPDLDPLMQFEVDRHNLSYKNGQNQIAFAVSADGTVLACNDRLDSLLVQDLQNRFAPKRFSFDQRWISGGMWFRKSARELLILLHEPWNDTADYNVLMLELAILDLETGEIRRQELGLLYQWIANYGAGARATFRAEHPEEAIASVTVSPTGRSIAFFRMPEGEIKGHVEVWDIDSWQRTLVADFPYGLGGLLFSSNDRYLAIISTAAHDSHGTDSNSLRVIDTLRNEVILDVETVGRPNHSYSAAFSPDGSQLATGTRCTGFQLWDLAAKTRVGHVQIAGCKASAMTTGLAYSGDGRRLYVASDNGEIRVVETDKIPESSTLH